MRSTQANNVKRKGPHMTQATIYSTPVCPYCVRAKMLLKQKQVSYQEIDVSVPAEREKMMDITRGARSVPQIFIGDVHVGGFDDLNALEQKGELDELLKK